MIERRVLEAAYLLNKNSKQKKKTFGARLSVHSTLIKN